MTPELKQRIITTLEWMITDMKWKNQVDRPDNAMYGDDENYSPELREAIAVLDELKGDNDG